MAHPAFKEIDLSNYKVAIGGGGAVIKATSEKWRALTGRHIKEGYGLSETSPVLSINPMSVAEFTGSCGLPVPSTEIKLLDDAGNEVAEGEAGEICARGPQVMQGYWNNPEANAAAFTPDGFFKTGDIGVFTEGGFLKIVDRKKDMIIVSGFNVYPNEVEAVMTACDGIAECACIGVADARTDEAVRVYAVKSPGAEITEADVIAHAGASSPATRCRGRSCSSRRCRSRTSARSCAANCASWPDRPLRCLIRGRAARWQSATPRPGTRSLAG